MDSVVYNRMIPLHGVICQQYIQTIIDSDTSNIYKVYITVPHNTNYSTLAYLLNGMEDIGSSAQELDTDNPYGEGGSATVGGGDGAYGDPDATDGADIPDLPTISAADLGFITMYNPTVAQLKSLSAYMWSNVFDLNTFKKLFSDQMQSIIGLAIVPVAPSVAGSKNVKFGTIDSGISMSYLSTNYVQLDCGSVALEKYVGCFMDNDPYTKISIYLPFIGIRQLSADDVIGGSIHVVYNIDVLTGACLAMLTTYKGSGADQSKILTYTYSGNCATQVPISGGSYAQMITGLASMALGVGTGIVSGNPLAVAGGAMAGVMSSHFDVSHSGSLSSNPGAMGPRKPFLIITRKSAYEAQGYNQFYGFPANLTVMLGSCKGYTRVKSVHIDSISKATDTEKTEIETLLRQGVIIKY